MKNHWYIYIVQTTNNKHYVGITNNIRRRLEEHWNGKGSKFLKANKPKDIKIITSAINRSEAMKIENKIKKLKPKKKMELFCYSPFERDLIPKE